MSQSDPGRPVPRDSEFLRLGLSTDQIGALTVLAENRRLSLASLNESDQKSISSAITLLHREKGISILQVSKMVGRSQGFLWNLCKNLGIKVRTPGEANTLSAPTRTKRPRSPFIGVLAEKLYYRGFADGDLTVQRVSRIAIMASSTTTHEAFVELFRNMFQKFGPVYVYPIRDTTGQCKWKVAARLDNSFEFLLPEGSLPETASGYSEAEFLSWIAGLVDSDGSINMSNSGGYIKLTISIHNNDKKLLLVAFNWLSQHGYKPSGPYRTLTEGKTTAVSRIRYKKDMWRIQVQAMGSAQRLLGGLPLRHAEKIERKILALKVGPGMRWIDVRSEILSLRRRMHRETRGFIQMASVSYKKKRGGKGVLLRLPES